MKAITLWQPWASLLAIGIKQYETRSWATSYRGPIAIHAAGKNPNGRDIWSSMDAIAIDAAREALGVTDFAELPRGYVIATAELVGCWQTYGDVHIIRCGDLKGSRPGRINDLVPKDELIWGDFSCGRYAWEFENVRLLDEPIRAKGAQRLWNWEPKGEENPL